MAAESSFDIVSRVDMQEVKNAVAMAQKEIAQRFDFKGSVAEIELTPDGLTLHAENEMKLKSVTDVLESKFVRRGVSLKALDYQTPEPAAKGTLRQKVLFKQGIQVETGRAIVKLVKDTKLKVHAQVQDEQVRVSGKNKDDLQKIIALVKEKITDTPVQFVNYR
jgi:uncharacterized protein YajQ (UPF0234 family)